jgi:hypothetical protein
VSDLDTITQAELIAALRECNIWINTSPDPPRVLLGRAIPEALGYSLVDWIQKHREPDYVDGAYYQTADGVVVQFDRFTRTWLMAGDEEAFGYGYPRRPLMRMIPVSEAEVYCCMPHEPEL